MSPELVGVLGMVALVVLLFMRVPVAIAMIAVGLGGFAAIINWTSALGRLGSDTFFAASFYSLSVIPLFVFMGLIRAASA